MADMEWRRGRVTFMPRATTIFAAAETGPGYRAVTCGRHTLAPCGWLHGGSNTNTAGDFTAGTGDKDREPTAFLVKEADVEKSLDAADTSVRATRSTGS